MQIVRITRKEAELHCPVTGLSLLDGDGEPLAPSLRGFWREFHPGRPVIPDADLEAAWVRYLDRSGAEPEEDGSMSEEAWCSVLMEEFLRFIDRPNWVAMEVHVPRFRDDAGPDVFWTVLDFETDGWSDPA